MFGQNFHVERRLKRFHSCDFVIFLKKKSIPNTRIGSTKIDQQLNKFSQLQM